MLVYTGAGEDRFLKTSHNLVLIYSLPCSLTYKGLEATCEESVQLLELGPALPDLPHDAGAHLMAGEAKLLHLRDRQPRAGSVVDTQQV